MASTDFFAPLKAQLGKNWGWFVAIGIILILLGIVAIANQLIATVVTIYYIGAVMLIAGIFQLIHAFQVRGSGLTLYCLATGLLYTLAGVIVFQNPLLASSVMTMLLAILLVASGLLRLWQGFKTRHYNVNSGWTIFSGVLSLLLGILIAAEWPVSSLWIIGLFIGIDLLFQGWSYVSIGLAAKAERK